jgi:hypothetical protein
MEVAVGDHDGLSLGSLGFRDGHFLQIEVDARRRHARHDQRYYDEENSFFMHDPPLPVACY